MKNSLNNIALLCLISCLGFSGLLAQNAEEIYDRYTTVSQLGMVITNYGISGNGYERVNGEILPSCQYKQHTEILREQVEHFSYAGVWIGGLVGRRQNR